MYIAFTLFHAKHGKVSPEYFYIHTYHSRFIPEGVAVVSQIFLRTPTFYQNLLAMRNTAAVTGGKPIAVLLQSISGVSAINPLVAFYDIHGGKREVLFLYFVPDTTQDNSLLINYHTYVILLTFGFLGVYLRKNI
jgi:hypothetical protein